MKEWAAGFYKSSAWKKTRAAYLKSKRGLCEICLSNGQITPADMVHHKVWLTPQNINDPNFTLNWNNLQALCNTCHASIHIGHEKRFKVDEFGRVSCL